MPPGVNRADPSRDRRSEPRPSIRAATVDPSRDRQGAEPGVESTMDTISEPALQATTHTNRISSWLGARWWPLAAAAISMLLSLPALRVGWVGDDYWHRYVLDAEGDFGELGILESDSFMHLFSFLDGDPVRNAKLIETGVCPWWMSLNVKGSFWRPLTGVSHLLDYRLWPKSAELMHLHSLLWGAALVVAVGLLHRRFTGPTWIAGLATLLYAIDDARGTPVGFLANRNALLAGTFGVLCILAHDQWRRRQWRPGAVIAPILLACSLLSKEAGVATVAYLFAHAICLDRGTTLQRIRILLPYAVVVIAWRIAWSALDFGFAGAELYVDPLARPLMFLYRCVERFPVLLFGQWGLLSDVALVLSGRAALIWWLVAVLALALIAWLVSRTISWDQTTKFWGLGMLLSVIPICTTFPSDRLLTFVGIGATPLLVRFFRYINWQPTLKVLVESGVLGDTRATQKILEDLKAAKVKTLGASAYKINTPRGVWKLNGIAEQITRLYNMTQPRADSARQTWVKLKGMRVGPFIAYQILQDMRWVHGQWPDELEWAFVGPGAARGLLRLQGRYKAGDWKSRRHDDTNLGMQSSDLGRFKGPMLDLLEEARAALGPSINLFEVEHNLCEWDKYCRIHTGESKGRPFRR